MNGAFGKWDGSQVITPEDLRMAAITLTGMMKSREDWVVVKAAMQFDLIEQLQEWLAGGKKENIARVVSRRDNKQTD